MVLFICLILWLRPTHQPHGGRDHVCLDTAFPIRGAGPEEPFNTLEGREGEGRKHLWSRVEEAESKADTRTHTEKARKGVER